MMILLTGCAGFIGMHVALSLLERGDQVIGVDNLNDYYDPALKLSRLSQLKSYSNFEFFEADIADRLAINGLFSRIRPRRVVHLAAQPGVRYSLINPAVYIQTNIAGFGNVLEGCRECQVEHLVYASSSSVYGNNSRIPFSTQDNVDHPVSLYAASKKANELMAHTYSHLYGIPTTGLRYFTVYGPWGRPDMSPWLFTSAILAGKPIRVFNYGDMLRDFTYIQDIAEGTVRVLDRPPNGASAASTTSNSPSSVPYKIYNIGSHQPIKLMDFIETLEDKLNKTAEKIYLPMQPGDVIATYADIEDLKRDIGFEPKTPLATGIENWVEWYKQYLN